jgi:hypothetical protein
MAPDLFSLLACVISLDTLRLVWKHRTSFWREMPHTQNASAERQLQSLIAQRIAIFLLIPIGVLLHEGGHAIATWQFGGQVEEFQWRVFWGYVIPRGSFSPVEVWWIAFSGNLVSILLGLLAIPAIPLMPKRVLREVLHSFAIAQCVYALICYPILSIVGFGGDWVYIYNLSIFPHAQMTIALQIVLLGGLWGLFKSRWLERFTHPLPSALATPPTSTRSNPVDEE